MIGKGAVRENFQPQSCSGKKSSRTNLVKGKLGNIITIDIDNDDDDVVILEFSDFLQQSLHGFGVPSKERVCTPQSVISIDDDDDESDNAVHPGNIAEGVGESDSDASSSKGFFPAPSRTQKFADVDDSHVYEKESKKQKIRQKCSAKASRSNRYGLDGSESESSKSDCSDCEVMEVRELWEKASVKRKQRLFNDQFGQGQHASSSSFSSNIYTDTGAEHTTKQHFGRPVYSGPSNDKYGKESQSCFSTKGDSQVNGINSNLGTENPIKDSVKKVDQESSEICRPECTEDEERTKSKELPPCSMYTYFNFCDFCKAVTGGSMSETELSGKESKTTCLGQEEAYERQIDNSGSGLRDNDGEASVSEKELGGKESKATSMGHESYERQVHNNRSALSKDGNLFEVNTVYSNCASFDERRVNCDGLVLHDENVGFNASNQTDIINEREKLKETDEYKRVIEEEWAARQRQLQIQAEEAQRLRKRKKAEAQRLLEMQRRQKERIEEVRETQKKDEEFMNLKEQLRVEIQRGLIILETQCRDMASLLRGLGIHVGGGIRLADEVRAAYKRALLKFHPDRASKADIRGQVEAEEKFKLISRMKDKLSLIS
ncbi:putative DnaJ domain-containing protein [Lupinus albus]|uniref:Putative DnaJ domain-containing protein n=1 Tax=Lupinus albus TaxID=3870 RepID=A0A6A4PVC0_LUPAL|nr:putative DnaJ domain-containing protein [Lupinus albus]